MGTESAPTTAESRLQRDGAMEVEAPSVGAGHEPVRESTVDAKYPEGTALVLYGKAWTLRDIALEAPSDELPREQDADWVMDRAKEYSGRMIGMAVYQKLGETENLEVSSEEVMGLYRFFRGIPRDQPDPNLSKGDYEFFEPWVKRAKLDRILYERYGGIVIFQQANPREPVGAYRALFEDLERQGNLLFLNDELAEDFWDYFRMDHPMQLDSDDMDWDLYWWEEIPDEE
ncbi:MAG: hypothetical protein R3F33_00305 [Planctomycetota bacterium]